MFFKKWKRAKHSEALQAEEIYSEGQLPEGDETLPYSPRELVQLLHRPMAEAFNRFGFQLAETYLQTENGTTVISPLSIETAFCLAYNGAAGKTAQEMAEVLGLSAWKLESINEALAKLKVSLENIDGSLQLKMANSLWLQDNWPFLPAYLQRMSGYEAAIHKVNFAEPETIERVNTWVSEQTQGLIETLVQPPLDPDTLAMLVNTLYFKGSWQDPFDPESTEIRPFYGENGTQQVPSMTRSDDFAYYLEPQSQTQMLRLFYGHSDFALLILLPPEGCSLQKWWDCFPFENWASLPHHLESRPGTLEFPRFDLASDLDLIPLLQKMGLRLPFDEMKSDFTEMAEIPPGYTLYINQVKHKTVFKVNEQGSEAAAATLLSMALGAGLPPEPPPPFEMKVNRPFVCCLQEVNSGTNLFVGLIQDLESET